MLSSHIYNSFRIIPWIVNQIVDSIYNFYILLFVNKKGSHNVIRKYSYIKNPNNIYIGNNLFVDRGVNINSETSNGKLIIGNDVHVGRNVTLDVSGTIELKNNVFFSDSVIVYTHSHGKNPRNKPECSDLIIEENTWIGSHVTILPKVRRIGKNCIIGYGVIIAKDVEDNTTLVGASNRVIE